MYREVRCENLFFFSKPQNLMLERGQRCCRDAPIADGNEKAESLLCPSERLLVVIPNASYWPCPTALGKERVDR
ncbi:hypothetical protein Nepgr_022507 [Nepenthes gracilis]|uniref:Uncharacterized protein n=1 Tax=Nepenthes gracilis TaxID=150966 RepID=A0AAD3T0Z4_NEPGR|nr:hypothetical protein Nepgr_022507 [Nepenthes gracilis]